MNVQYISTSCINEVMNAKASEKENIEIGLAATMFVGSDRYAMVVTEVLGPKKIRVNHMDDTDYNSLNEDDKIQKLSMERMTKYAITTDGNKHWEGMGKIYTLRKNGRWMPEGEGLWGTCSIHLGHANNYMDPSF